MSLPPSPAPRPAGSAPSAASPAALPILGITLGDPAGIGPEILARALCDESVESWCVPVVIGDGRVLAQAFELVGRRHPLQVLTSLDCRPAPGAAYLLDLGNVDPAHVPMGQVSSRAGRAAGEYIEQAVAAARAGHLDAITTNPIHKEAFTLAGYGAKYPGHTEMLTALTGATSTCMMLTAGELRVCHVTTHVSLLEAVRDRIRRQRILEVIRLADDACRRLGVGAPTIGVAALNPHAGEGGLFGDEERREIGPAVEQARSEGIAAVGPLPADTLFSRAVGGEFAATVAMYHDQGHIPVKLLGFRYDGAADRWQMSGVNVTLGLPIVRTSVDHGTAFDRAGQGTANHQSLVEAMKLAARLAAGTTAPRADAASVSRPAADPASR